MEFIKFLAYGIKPANSTRSAQPNERRKVRGPSIQSVVQYYDVFQNLLLDRGTPIDPKVSTQIRKYIFHNLRVELDCPFNVRPRRWPKIVHFIHLGQQLFVQDWIKFPSAATRVYFWAWFSCNVASGSRIGELVESSARGQNCDRGLRFKDARLIVIRKEDGQPGLAFEFERDAKGMTLTPNERPRHAIYEAPEGQMLLLNPILPILAIILSRGALRDYKTIQDILRIPAPPKGQDITLTWSDEVLSQPVFPRIREGSGLTDKMETANKVGEYLRALGFRAGFPEPLTIHDFRAEYLQLLG
ncbi:uncharacterized protein JN550_007926 [Neoarthrinium moseri]|uniref:uncharacterized protein n=1 Tax=Neoarthrinium moseri TaxID=1658444 RepID=UPI001FDBB7FF|nr:uncharacterized protein JN550_007926 [Neoarthrinium moseri]KAI1865948.1 hypothetical protein JN550_007926 [Neoarthrinium moseri]